MNICIPRFILFKYNAHSIIVFSQTLIKTIVLDSKILKSHPIYWKFAQKNIFILTILDKHKMRFINNAYIRNINIFSYE